MDCCKSKSKGSNVKENKTHSLTLSELIESRQKLLIWVLGGPGSGKGTQCEMLALRFKLAHLATDVLVREQVASLKSMISKIEAIGLPPELERITPLAKDFKFIKENATVVDTGFIMDVLMEAMSAAFESSSGFLIDGYPRETAQGELLCKRFGTPHLIIYLDCPDNILEERLVKRGEESGRVDDNVDTIRNRLKTFHDVSEPLLQRWKDKVVSIDGTKTPVEVEAECIRVIEEMQKKYNMNNISGT